MLKYGVPVKIALNEDLIRDENHRDVDVMALWLCLWDLVHVHAGDCMTYNSGRGLI